MTIVVGVDAELTSRKALHCLKALGCQATLHLVHVIEPILPDGGTPALSPGHPMTEIYEQLNKDGQDMLKEMEKEASSLGFETVTQLAFGNPATELIAYCDEVNASLVAVTSNEKDSYSSVFFGSVAKGLLIGAQCSVLAVKTDVKEPVTAMFATDHSDYSRETEAVLRDLDMKGINTLTVMTAEDESRGSFMSLFSDDDIVTMKSELAEKTSETEKRLSDLVKSTEHMIIKGRPNQAIHEAMESSGSSLLIMGAQGHGFFARIFVGSKSFHQVMNEHYSVLVLRVDEDRRAELS